MKALVTLSFLFAIAARPAQAELREQTIDLAAPSPAVPVIVPEGQDLEVVFSNVALGATYRLTFKDEHGSRSQPLSRPFDNGFGNYAPPPECADVKQEGLTIIASTDEVQVVQRIKALQAKLGTGACAEALVRRMLEQPILMTRVSTREIRRLTPGLELTVMVERLSPDGNTAVRTWVTTFRGRGPDVGWAFPDEQTWVVHEVAQDILEMVEFARTGARGPSAGISVGAEPASTGAASGFRIKTASGVSLAVGLDPHAWAPQAYAPLARSLMDRGGVKGALDDATTGGSLVGRLTDLRATVIEAENQRVSKRLTARPMDVQAHEEAALVVGALALREAAGDFTDIRHLLSRMSAHLAVAQAIRRQGRLGPDGRVAEVLLTTLVERQTEALESLARMKEQLGTTTAEKAWINALRMRNSGDWRLLTEPAKATLLERVEYFRAMTMADSASRALQALPIRSLEAVPDWGRAALGSAFSVEEGHLFAKSALSSEVEELQQLWRLAHGTAPPREEISSVLKAVPGRALHIGPDGRATLQVLDWGAWASAASHHIYADVAGMDSFLRELLGLKDAADAFSKRAVETLGVLPLYEFATVRRKDPWRKEFCAVADKVIRGAPETLTASNWDVAYRRCGRVAPNVPVYSSWFSPIVPRGTALDAYKRLLAMETALRVGLPEIEGLRRLAPFNGNILLAYLGRKYQGKGDPAAIVQEFGTMAEYQVSALRRLGEGYKRDPARYRALLEKLCSFSADRCSDLGGYLVSIDAADAAAIAYQRAVDHGLDRVRVSHDTDWLVNYYQDRGEPVKALAVATLAAETYSAAGLATMARYQERLKEYDEAVKYYQRIAERYEDDSALSAFYIRYQASVGGGRFAAEAAAATHKIFPKGLQKIAPADLKGPVQGIPIVNAGSVGESWGLRPGDVVVALDGYRVESHQQYGAIKAMSDDPKMRLLVSQGGKYLEVTGDRNRVIYFQPPVSISP